MEYIRNKTPFNSNKFLNLAQAVETYHRRTSPLTKGMPNEDHEKRLQDILATTSSDHHTYLTEALKYSNELSLGSRLKDILNSFKGTPLNVKFPTKKSGYDYRVVETRNYYTHYSIEKEKLAFKGEDLERATQSLFFILLCAIYRELGMFNGENSDLRYKQLLKAFEYFERFS